MSTSLSLLRQTLREIRLSVPAGSKIQKLPITSYIMKQFRKNQVTDKQHCKANKEMFQLAANYKTYLESQRLWFQVHQEYHSKSERSVEETAKMVGFKLPHDPK